MSSAISNAEYQKRITVFTPTYNRAYILPQLYHTLQRQSFLDFEWLIVDDGSTDDTEKTVQQWIEEENPFAIVYYKQQNGGKHRAVNKGLSLAQGEIFFVVDSDDYLTDDALEKMDRWFEEIGVDSLLVSVAANKGTSPTQTVNAFFDEPYLDQSFLDMGTYREHGKLVLNGERAIAFYTDIHRKYLYPEFPGERFLTEAIVYNRMANEGYKTRFFNDIIVIYEYREDGLSSDGTEIYLKNPHGYGLWFKERAEFLHEPLIKKWKMYYSFYCDLRERYPLTEIAECIGAPATLIGICKMLFSLKHIGKGY